MNQLEYLLQRCTVKLSFPHQTGWGTGFFVAPEWILTCAHVLERKNQPFQVRWQNRENWAEAVVERLLPDDLYDLALLRVTLPTNANPPCVYLDKEVKSRDPLYLFGYPDRDFPNGCPVTGSCEGLTGDEPAFIKFAVGQVRPGMSGSPLLNQRTGKVCGMVKFTRDPSFDLGGGAIQTVVILAQFPELLKQQQLFHQSNKLWLRQIEAVSQKTQSVYQQLQAKDIILQRLKDLGWNHISFNKLREITGRNDWDDNFLNAVVDNYREVFGPKLLHPGLLGLKIKKENQAKDIILKRLKDLGWNHISFNKLREITGRNDWDDNFLNAVVDNYTEVFGHKTFFPNYSPGLCLKQSNPSENEKA